ncbi:rhodanese-like domain-containing protein [Thioclava sp. GXIMD2076]|uniref:rhodanese-like domain-containing protein n=1 Tax=unclassified Thioclava TaxID=2621713 RepID=UPI0030D2E604
MNAVLSRPPVASADIVTLLERQCALHTDCSDVHAAMSGGDAGFVLIHAMGTPATYARRHIPDAVFMPHRTISAEALASYPQDTLFVVYCSGPHCNAAEQAALAFARLRRPVKIMLGGLMGWEYEGFAFAGEAALA